MSTKRELHRFLSENGEKIKSSDICIEYVSNVAPDDDLALKIARSKEASYSARICADGVVRHFFSVRGAWLYGWDAL